MNIVRDYIEYLQDNPEGYWFKRKLYGFGWVPARKQGWITLGLYLVFVFGLIYITPADASGEEVLTHIIAPILGATFVLIVVSWKTGESLKWQWGLDKSQDPSQ